MSKQVNWFLLCIIYSGWALTIWFHKDLPIWVLMPAGAILLAWQSSFQHEAVHGHLASRRWVNDALAWPPLSLWLPFPIYCRSHRTHHHFERLTDPYRDPESFYVDQKSWAALPRIVQYLLTWHHTFPGRLILGPFLAIGQFLIYEARALRSGDRQNLKAWLWHVPAVSLVLVWVTIISGMTVSSYLLVFVLPGTSLTLIRSFAEHKAANTAFERTAIVEAGKFFSLLFLNNNLHFAHHRRPDLPWRALPSFYRSHRRDLLQENGGLCYQGGYWEIAKRFLTRPIDRPAHPFI